MRRECLTEDDLLALLAGDASGDEWQEHLAGCATCRNLRSKQEPLQRALEPARHDAALQRLTRAARSRLEDVLKAEVRPIAYYDVWPDSPVGQLFLAVSQRGLCAVSFRTTEDDFLRGLLRRGFQPVLALERVRGAMGQLQE